MKKERNHYTAEEKVAILRRHLLDQVPVSVLCEEKGLQPTVFYRWQKEFFENGASAFQAKEHPARQIVPRVIVLIGPCRAGISHLQRLPVSITRATIFQAETPPRSPAACIESGGKP
ncbi:MAG: transposase [Candidatus Sulfotelmatobacter sp.]